MKTRQSKDARLDTLAIYQPASKPACMAGARFIRSCPPSLPASLVVERARTTGLTTTRQAVERVRARQQAPSRYTVKKSRPVVLTRPVQDQALKGSDALELQVRILILDLGCSKTLEIMDQVRSRITGVLEP